MSYYKFAFKDKVHRNIICVFLQATWRKNKAYFNTLFTIMNILINQVLLYPC